jgi:hypothetical protein
MTATNNSTCGDCGVQPGQPHDDGCDVARCLATGGQRLSCGGCDNEPPYAGHDCGADVWTGLWPGAAECVEYGRYSYFVPNQGWLPCGPDHPGARPDLNRLVVCCDWDREARRWVRRDEVTR